MHFFNPAPVLKLVEVIRTVVTDAQVIDDVKALSERLGKVPVVVGDKAGFIANALLFGYLNHAVSMYEQRYATREDIDAAMKLGCGLPMGPLALLDLIGLDTAYEILDTMYKQTRDRLHAPAPIIKQMVTAGVKGRKTGRGFYTYEAPDSPVVVADAQTPVPNGDGVEARDRSSGSGVVGSGTMAVGIAEVFAKAGYDVVLRARGTEQIDKARAVHRAVAGEGRRPRQDHRGGARRRARRGSPAAPRSTTSPTATSSSRPRSRSSRSSRRSSPPSTRSPSRARSWRPRRRACRSSRSRPPPSRMADVVGMHFFNPAPVMKLVEVVHTINTAPEVVDDHPRRSASGSASTRSPAATAPASSSTRCSSRT